MRVESLKSPGAISNGYALRLEVARAISNLELSVARSNSPVKAAAGDLYDFLVDAASKITALVPGPAPTAAVSSTNTITISWAAALEANVAILTSAFEVFDADGEARTVSAVTVSGTDVALTVTGADEGDTVYYNPPAADPLVDDATGRIVDSFVLVAE